jgi:hypothetical protein
MERGYRPNPVWSPGAMLNWGALKMQDQKMQDTKMSDQNAGLENAGPENDGPNWILATKF